MRTLALFSFLFFFLGKNSCFFILVQPKRKKWKKASDVLLGKKRYICFHVLGNIMQRKNNNIIKQKFENLQEDYMSKLQDELLISIMCKLSLNEIASTRAVSRRWKKLWISTIQVMPKLEFYGVGNLKLKWCCETNDGERDEYVNWVNKVMNFRSLPILEELKISYNLTSKHSDDVNKWIEFAAKKGVKKLMLNFGDIMNSFPIVVAINCTPMHRLRNIWTREIKAGEDFIECLMSNSPFLERICLIESQNLYRLEFSASDASNLKCLEIRECDYLESFIISAPNLESLLIINNWNLNAVKIFAPILNSFIFRGSFNVCVQLKAVPACISDLSSSWPPGEYRWDR